MPRTRTAYARRRRQRMHEGKWSYSTEEGALSAAIALSIRYDHTYHAYPCEFCTAYHVGRDHWGKEEE
jgi:hypothetical protein